MNKKRGISLLCTIVALVGMISSAAATTIAPGVSSAESTATTGAASDAVKQSVDQLAVQSAEPLAETLAQIENAAVMAIDRRFLTVIQLFNQQFPDAPPVNLVFQDNQYALQQQQRIIARFEDLGFYTLHEGLRLTAAALMGTQSKITQRINRDLSQLPLTINELIAKAIAHNTQAQTDDESLATVAQHLVLMNFLVEDTLDAMDIVQANSWMLVAWLESRTGVRDDGLLTLLAHNLGYTVFAEHTAAKLGDHPLTNFYDTEAITGNTPIATLFRIKKAAHYQDVAAWQDQVLALQGKPVSLTHILYGLRHLDAYQIRSKYLLLYPLMVYHDFLGSKEMNHLVYQSGSLRLDIDAIDEMSHALAKPVDFSPSLLINHFEQAIHKQTPLPVGGVLHEAVLINYWQSRLLNAYYDMAVYLTEIESNQLLAERLLRVFAENAHSQTGLLLYRWFRVMAAQEDTYQQAVDQFILIADSPLASVPILTALLDRQYYLRPTVTAAYLAGRETLFSRLDSRYHHQTKRFRINAQSGGELLFSLKKNHYRLNQDVLIGLNHLGDVALIQQALTYSEQPNDRVALLNLLFQYGAGDAQALTELKKHYEEKGSFFMLKNYVDALLMQSTRLVNDSASDSASGSISHSESQATVAREWQKTQQSPHQTSNNYADEAIQALDEWITQRRDISRRDYLELISLIARAKAADGDLSNAWRAIFPTLGYRYPPAMRVAADVSLAQKKITQTQQIIADYKRLHPSTLSSLAYQLRSLLLQQKYDSALDLVTNWYFPLSAKQFQQYVIHPIRTMPLTDAEKKALSAIVSNSTISHERKAQLSAVLQ
ncbi:hypothetical protein [Ostreibacterium oceani]|uniref:Uncharacterized protein n=1 Tax=Ostreibacterium oceani TaxID=2654998 RepID=A0A6N7EUD1_9GAMM|nr:hypothetical protein [Ostreibacterium oceani]MPV85593.1 hypothetical protein [Ostreibacterium oceani]